MAQRSVVSTLRSNLAYRKHSMTCVREAQGSYLTCCPLGFRCLPEPFITNTGALRQFSPKHVHTDSFLTNRFAIRRCKSSF